MVTKRGSTAQLMDLNDDCLESILRKLNVFEQFRITKLHARFKNIIQSIWRTKLNSVLIHSELFTYATTATTTIVQQPQNQQQQQQQQQNEFVEFVNAIAPYTRHLVMRSMPVAKLRLLSEQTLPQVQIFDWLAASTEEQEQLLDEDISMLKQLFPHLTKLKLQCCQITGKHLSDLSSLQQLSLDECHFLESEYFRDVLQNLKLRKFDIMEDCDELNCCDLVEVQKCPTLEHIKIADYHLCLEPYILNSVLNMPQLRKLSIYSKNFVFDVLERVARNDAKTIVAFKYNGIMAHTERFFTEIGHMHQLQKLSFFECCTYERYERIHDHVCLAVSKQLQQLREIHFNGCVLESELALLHFVANCRDLALVNIAHSECIGNPFIWRCLDMLRKQKWRKRPLEVWIRGTAIDKCIVEDPRIIANERLLKIDLKQYAIDSNPPGVLKFTFAT